MENWGEQKRRLIGTQRKAQREADRDKEAVEKAKSTNDTLRDMQQLMHSELDKISGVSSSLDATTSMLKNTNSHYSKYESNMNEAKVHVKDIQKRELYEAMLINFAYYFFIAVVVYIVLKRFYLHEILGVFVSVVGKVKDSLI